MSPDADSPADAGKAATDGASLAAESGDAESDADRESSLLAALDVTAHARVGLAVGIGLAGYLYLVALPGLELSVTGSGGYYLGLALVLAATTAAVVTAALSLRTFLLPVVDVAAWRRRGAVAAVLGGVTWAALPGLALLVDAGTISRGLWHTATGLAAIALLVGAIALHGAVADATGRVERGAYWTILVALLFAAGNATGDPSAVTVTEEGVAATPFLVSAFVATVATIPFAATAELSGRLPRLRTRALQVGALLGTLGVAWVIALDGWSVLEASGVAAGPAVLALATVPPGLGWAAAGQGLWRSATPARLESRSTTPATDDG